jgi:hypothetical protein
LLYEALPRLPAEDQTHFPVTLELGDRIFVRARAAGSEHVTELKLRDSRAQGQPHRLCVNWQHLLRFLEMGFREQEVIKPDQPVLCRDGARIYFWLPLDPKGALPPDASNMRIAAEHSYRIAINPEPERREAMPPPIDRVPPEPDKSNGHPATPPTHLEGLRNEAEELRAVFQEANCGPCLTAVAPPDWLEMVLTSMAVSKSPKGWRNLACRPVKAWRLPRAVATMAFKY